MPSLMERVIGIKNLKAGSVDVSSPPGLLGEAGAFVLLSKYFGGFNGPVVSVMGRGRYRWIGGGSRDIFNCEEVVCLVVRKTQAVSVISPFALNLLEEGDGSLQGGE